MKSTLFHTTLLRAIFLLLFALPSAYGQADTVATRKWSYGVTFAPGIHYRRLHAGSGEGWIKDRRDDAEIPRFSYAAGVLINRRISHRVSIGSGLVYNDLGFKTRHEPLQWPDAPDSGEAYVVTRYRYIQLPVDVYYTLHQRTKTRWFVAGGVSPAVFIQRSNVMHYNAGNGWAKDKDNQGTGYDRFNFMATARVGMEYELSSVFALQGSLFYKQLLKATNSNLASKDVLYAAGIALALVYQPGARRTP